MREAGISLDKKLPRHTMSCVIKENIDWTVRKRKPKSSHVRSWYDKWRKSSGMCDGAAVAEVSQKSLLKSRAPKQTCHRKRFPGAGHPYRCPLIRQEFYEWFTSIRYAIDWKKMRAELRSRGMKKHLARFPRSILVYKVYELLQDYAHACLVSGVKVEGFMPQNWWFKRWEESMD